ncbi:hypothetical protein [Methylococcus sp. EFPC2]|uniref:hypothetical protein n=1 Tax=Methylococcus sp. EFPC2 TaxID=2812648 RepID=UPI0019671091|nr:hypothetical protein [Methylococcus sp. EFPC2]QSA97846.1 hypothetical protein JWZ97_03190 [Methylococcus sp. EFPC2]
MWNILFFLGALLLLALSGCSGLGPGSVSRDRFDYTAALSDSWKDEMLLNIVKLRYGDAPVFLDVASIITQYQLQGSLSLSGSWYANPTTLPAQVLGGQGTYSERPTITYSPLIGERFARSLMTPVPPSAIISLIQAGYPADLVFRLTVHSVNGLQNRYGGQSRARLADPRFYRLIELLRQQQMSNAIGLRLDKIDQRTASLLIIRGEADEEARVATQEIRHLLGLNPAAKELRVVYGSVAKDDQEIAILSRSILDILVDLASYIEVPAKHVAENRVNQTLPAENHAGKPLVPLLRIHNSPDKPGNAFIAVPYRDHWYWLDDRDINSKRGFSFLMFVFTLVETGDKTPAPVVTIPTG